MKNDEGKFCNFELYEFGYGFPYYSFMCGITVYGFLYQLMRFFIYKSMICINLFL